MTTFLYAFGLGIIYASFFEWLLHRFIMHRPFMGFKYPFKTHALTHHTVFQADNRYHLQHEDDKGTIPMKWWNGPVLVIIGTIPFVVLTPFIFALGICLALTAYYLTYEYLHWCFHLPKGRRIERSWLFRRLNGHHLLHHRYMKKNFNVVLPLADFLLRTLLVRSKIAFPQARGEAVPDVQPEGHHRVWDDI